MKLIATALLKGTLGLPVWTVLLGTLELQAAQVSEIQRRLTAGEKIAFVDVRSTDFYQKGHLPGAINVPLAILSDKRLPKLGRVVVYDDGLGAAQADAAMPLLNQKPGIQAEVLDGGYAAWMESKGATTTAAGMTKEEIPMITYQKLKGVSTDDLVLVDLRTPPSAVASGPAVKSAEPAAPLTDLRAEFPGAAVTRSAFAVPSTRKSTTPGAGGSPLMVLVDNGDGTAEQTARALKANGISRFVILVGGEQSLARQGQAGLQRLGQTVEAPTTVTPKRNP